MSGKKERPKRELLAIDLSSDGDLRRLLDEKCEREFTSAQMVIKALLRACMDSGPRTFKEIIDAIRGKDDGNVVSRLEAVLDRLEYLDELCRERHGLLNHSGEERLEVTKGTGLDKVNPERPADSDKPEAKAPLGQRRKRAR